MDWNVSQFQVPASYWSAGISVTPASCRSVRLYQITSGLQSTGTPYSLPSAVRAGPQRSPANCSGFDWLASLESMSVRSATTPFLTSVATWPSPT